MGLEKYTLRHWIVASFMKPDYKEKLDLIEKNFHSRPSSQYVSKF
jgi:hypothetical protein